MTDKTVLFAYKTVSTLASVEITEKKSRFIAHVKPVTTEQEAIEFIESIKTKYWDATHNVYAYVIGSVVQRYSDDGEPQGTAGIPTLEVIKKEELKDIVVVVTRYFGGTMLGAGGLVRAYSKSAKEGIVSANIITKKLCTLIKIIAPYTLLGKIQNEIANNNHIIEEIIYEQDVSIYFLVEKTKTDNFIKKIIDFTNSKVYIEVIREKYIDIDERG